MNLPKEINARRSRRATRKRNSRCSLSFIAIAWASSSSPPSSSSSSSPVAQRTTLLYVGRHSWATLHVIFSADTRRDESITRIFSALQRENRVPDSASQSEPSLVIALESSSSWTSLPACLHAYLREASSSSSSSDELTLNHHSGRIAESTSSSRHEELDIPEDWETLAIDDHGRRVDRARPSRLWASVVIGCRMSKRTAAMTTTVAKNARGRQSCGVKVTRDPQVL